MILASLSEHRHEVAPLTSEDRSSVQVLADDGPHGPITDADSSPSLVDLFGALANPDRLAILQELAHHSSTGTDWPLLGSISAIAEQTGLSRFAASRHLSVLKNVDLVTAKRVGYRTLHMLKRRRFDQIEDWLYTLADPTG